MVADQRKRLPVFDDSDEVIGWVISDGSKGLVRAQGGFLPAEFFLDLPGVDNEPSLAATFGVGDQGAVMCLSVTIAAKPQGQQVLSKDLDAARQRLNEWMEVAYRQVLQDANGDPVFPDSDDRTPEAMAARQALTRAYTEARRRTRRKITPDLLAEVAKLYRANIDSGTWLAIQDRYGVAESTAGRYVMLARQAGLIPPTDPGQKKA